MNKLIYLLLFWSSLLTAQFVTRNDLQTLSDSELLSTLNKAREQGYSTEQIVSFAEAKGATAALSLYDMPFVSLLINAVHLLDCSLSRT